MSEPGVCLKSSPPAGTSQLTHFSNDNFNQIANNVSTVLDLLDTKGISWGIYQEDMPYSGFEGFAWINQKSGANDYVRKHNPPVLYNSNTANSDRLTQMKNISMFQKDLANNQLPQVTCFPWC